MQVSQSLDVTQYCNHKIMQPKSFGYFVRQPRAFEDSLRVLLETIRLRLPALFPAAVGHPRLFPPDLWWWCEHALREPVGKKLVHHVYSEDLTEPKGFVPPPVFALFWALEKGETDFVEQCIPLWSDEERLTGGLLRSLGYGLSVFEAAFSQLAGTDRGEARLDFFIADLSIGGRERQTGADFGVIVDVSLPNENRFVKACRFQAKKAYANGKARIDLGQVEAMLACEHIGYELFYHEEVQHAGEAPPPTV